VTPLPQAGGGRADKTAEVTHRHRHPGSRDDIPVIYITVPPAATGKMIAMEIARFLGLRFPAGPTSPT
jgi:hypothetical protein